MSFADIPLEKRAEMRKKAAATRSANAAKRKLAALLPQDDDTADIIESVALSAEFDVPAASLSLPPLSDVVDDDRPEPEEVLSQAEIDAIYQAAAERLRKDRIDKRKAEIMEKALRELREQMGEMPDDDKERQKWLAELVDIPISLPRLKGIGGKEHLSDPIIIDQVIFHPGRISRVTRAQAQTLIDMMWRAKVHAAQVDGRSRHYFDEAIGKVVYMGGAAGSGFGRPGVTFDAVHKRTA